MSTGLITPPLRRESALLSDQAALAAFPVLPFLFFHFLPDRIFINVDPTNLLIPTRYAKAHQTYTPYFACQMVKFYSGRVLVLRPVQRLAATWAGLFTNKRQ